MKNGNAASPDGTHDGAESERLLRRDEAARFLTEEIGFPMTKGRLEKLALTGDGPAWRVAGRRFCVYEPAELRRWAKVQLSEPVRSTTESKLLTASA